MTDIAGTRASGQGSLSPLTAADKANVLIEALPWLQRYSSTVMVIKYDGDTMNDEGAKRAFAQDVVFLHSAGVRPVVVHGGGMKVPAMLSRLGVEYQFRSGLRVTTPEAMEVIRMVLVGQVGREMVGLINSYGALAVGMSGEDGGLFRAKRTAALVDGGVVDIGLVGEVVGVDPAAVLDVIQAGRIPVISTIAPDESGEVLNISVDLAAAELAIALGAAKLILLSGVHGLEDSSANQSTTLSQIGAADLEVLIPRLETRVAAILTACLRAVRAGVPEATVIDGRAKHSVLLEVFTPEGSGTVVLPEASPTNP